MRRPVIVMAGIGILLAAIPMLAHHSFSAEYDQSKVLSLQGKMVQFDWVNPHSWIYVEVTGASGEKAVWKGETPPINVLYRNGWTKPLVEEMVKNAEVVTLRGPAAKGDAGPTPRFRIDTSHLPSGRRPMPNNPRRTAQSCRTAGAGELVYRSRCCLCS